MAPDLSGRRKVAVTDRTADGQVDIWVLDIEREARSRLTLNGNSILPIWTPDGKEIVFGSPRAAPVWSAIYWTAADGSGEPQLMLEGDNPRFPIAWSPDGRHLAFVEWHPQNMRDIWISTWRLEQTQTDRRHAVRRVLAEVLSRRTLAGLRFQRVGALRGLRRVLPGGSWSLARLRRGRYGAGVVPDGRELFYRNGNEMMEVPVRTEPTFSVGPPNVLFARAFKTGVYDSLTYESRPTARSS